MVKKKNAMVLDPRLNTMIENAYYQVNPPDQPAFQVKIRSDVELFLIHLINEQLDFRSCDRISKILRRFNWEDPKVSLLFKF
jgi:regulator of nonsense transcripts 2